MSDSTRSAGARAGQGRAGGMLAELAPQDPELW